MTGQELIDLFEKAYRRTYVVGTRENGVIIALDLEGRLFTVLNNRVVSKVNPSAILKRSNKETFQNPGGDALWPAPEGSTLGYEYSTGNWRVPPSITGSDWEVISHSKDACLIRSEIDLINNNQLGIPCEFERHIKIHKKENGMIQEVRECIRYIGNRILKRTEFSLAPWSLCQFDSSDSGKVIMPVQNEEDIWDMYSPSESQRKIKDGLCIVKTKTPVRFQLALSKNIPWIEYVSKTYRVKRWVKPLPKNQYYIDIADVSPSQPPSDKGVSLSLYCDPSGFLEIEACGGSIENLEKNTELTVDIITEFEII